MDKVTIGRNELSWNDLNVLRMGTQARLQYVSHELHEAQEEDRAYWLKQVRQAQRLERILKDAMTKMGAF